MFLESGNRDTMKLIILSLIILNAHCFQITRFLGKQADPCAEGLWNRNSNFQADPTTSSWSTWNNCPVAGKPLTLPAASTTILIPSISPPNANPNNQLTADQTSLTLVGRNFDKLVENAVTAPALAGTVIARMCIGLRAQPNRYCVPSGAAATSACDTTYFNNVDQIVRIPGNTTAATFTLRLTGAGHWGLLPTWELARPLCIIAAPTATSGGAFWSGLTIGTVYACNNDNDCAGRSTTDMAAGLGIAQKAELAAQTKCCNQSTPTNLWSVPAATTFQLRTCINPNVQSCCGATPILTSQEKCCSPTMQTVAFIDTPCICTVDSDCGITNEKCCLRTKYDSSNNFPNFKLSDDRLTTGYGQCYNTLNEQCCNTGQRFDPGSQQCCAISGLQSLEQPCPCSLDTHCNDPTGTRTNLECCTSSIPSTSPLALDRCDLFSQYPSAGTSGSNSVVQGCRGVCIDRRYQTCCYGKTCVTEYERCCNSTCCNRFVGTCKNARRSGAPGFPSNPTEYADNNGQEYLYWQCSTIEHLDTVKAFLLFALPAILLASSLSALGLALVFANKSSPRRYSFLERTLITFAVISVLLILPVFFSPLYKYAEVVVLASVIAVITAAVRVRWLNLFAIIVLAVTVIYIFDPFYGNALLTLAYNRQFAGTQYFLNPTDMTSGTPDVETSGLLHATAQLHMNHRQALQTRACVTFYDYFVVDQSLLDLDRRDLAENTTFGYCSRAYVIALLFFEGIASIFVLLQFVVALLAIIVRFRKQKFDPIELEVMAVPVDD